MKKIALISPSSPSPDLTPDTIKKIQSALQEVGYQIHLESHALDSDRYLAGTDSNRAIDVMRAFTDNSVDIVMTTRGGYGSPRILDQLDYATLKKNPKPFITLSDGTALQTALFTLSNITGYSGIQASFWLKEKNKSLIRTAIQAIQGQLPPIPIQKVWTSGSARGVMVGGNLIVFESLLGTPYFPNMEEKILVIEEVNESPYKVDRMLAHLRLAGVFDKISGLVLGDFSSCIASDPKDGTIDDVLQDYFNNAPFPVVQINYGHRNRDTVVPIGKPVLIDTIAGIVKELL